jgi:hypothetical protein
MGIVFGFKITFDYTDPVLVVQSVDRRFKQRGLVCVWGRHQIYHKQSVFVEMLPVVLRLVIIPVQQVLQHQNGSLARYRLVRKFTVSRRDVAAAGVAQFRPP